MDIFEGIALQRSSAAKQVADGLSLKITRGEIKAGAPLRENAIASSLHISRNTVREAIRILEQSGLVKHELHRGTVVIEPSITELAELYHARMRLEVAAVSIEASSAGLDNLKQAFAELSTVARLGDAQEIVMKDLAFHAATVALLGSRRIDALYENLTRELQFYLMVLSVEDREHERPDFVVREHEVILDAIVGRDVGQAVQAVTAHIEKARGRLTSILLARTAED